MKPRHRRTITALLVAVVFVGGVLVALATRTTHKTSTPNATPTPGATPTTIGGASGPTITAPTSGTCAAGSGKAYPVTSYGAHGDGSSNDAAAFTAAIAAAAAGHGYVSVPAPSSSYRISSTVALMSGVSVIGASPSVAITGGVSHGYMFRGTGLDSMAVSCLSLDLGHTANGSGLSIRQSNGVTLSELTINNVTEGWGINLGTPDATSTQNSNTNIVVTNDNFSGFDSKYEELLVFNSSHVTVSGCHFGSAAFHSSGGGLGLYQNDDTIVVEHNTFGPDLDNSGSYYSVTVNNVSYLDNTFIGNSSTTEGNVAIKGANASDHGLFGQSVANNYTITGNTFTHYRIALQLGAVVGGQVTNNHFVANDVAVRVDDGNPPVRSADSGVIVETNVFEQNGIGALPNSSSTAATVLVRGSGGTVGVTLTRNEFLSTGSGAAAVEFDGNHVWQGLTITDNSFPGSASSFIAQDNGARVSGAQVAAN